MPFEGRGKTNLLAETGRGDAVFYNVVYDPDDPDQARDDPATTTAAVRPGGAARAAASRVRAA